MKNWTTEKLEEYMDNFGCHSVMKTFNRILIFVSNQNVMILVKIKQCNLFSFIIDQNCLLKYRIPLVPDFMINLPFFQVFIYNVYS